MNASNHAGCTPLILASHAGHMNVIRELLKHPMVDLNAEDYKGTTALTVAIENERILEVIEELSGHQDTVVAVETDNGVTALLVLSDVGDPAINVNSGKRRREEEEEDDGVSALAVDVGSDDNSVTALLLSSDEGDTAVNANPRKRRRGRAGLLYQDQSDESQEETSGKSRFAISGPK